MQKDPFASKLHVRVFIQLPLSQTCYRQQRITSNQTARHLSHNRQTSDRGPSHATGLPPLVCVLSYALPICVNIGRCVHGIHCTFLSYSILLLHRHTEHGILALYKVVIQDGLLYKPKILTTRKNCMATTYKHCHSFPHSYYYLLLL